MTWPARLRLAVRWSGDALLWLGSAGVALLVLALLIGYVSGCLSSAK